MGSHVERGHGSGGGSNFVLRPGAPNKETSPVGHGEVGNLLHTSKKKKKKKMKNQIHEIKVIIQIKINKEVIFSE